MWSPRIVATGTPLTPVPGSSPSGGREASWQPPCAWPSASLAVPKGWHLALPVTVFRALTPLMSFTGCVVTSHRDVRCFRINAMTLGVPSLWAPPVTLLWTQPPGSHWQLLGAPATSPRGPQSEFLGCAMGTYCPLGLGGDSWGTDRPGKLLLRQPRLRHTAACDRGCQGLTDTPFSLEHEPWVRLSRDLRTLPGSQGWQGPWR